jgi:hypothetical protein
VNALREGVILVHVGVANYPWDDVRCVHIFVVRVLRECRRQVWSSASLQNNLNEMRALPCTTVNCFGSHHTNSTNERFVL